MPKDNEVDEKVMPVAWIVTNGGQSCEPWLVYERSELDAHPADCIADPLYSAATVAELRAEVESERKLRMRAEGLFVEWKKRHDYLIDGISAIQKSRDAAERRVGDVTALLDQCFTSEIERVSTVEFNSNSICRKFYGELKARFSKALTGADPT
jgi:hypothetical protein